MTLFRPRKTFFLNSVELDVDLVPQCRPGPLMWTWTLDVDPNSGCDLVSGGTVQSKRLCCHLEIYGHKLKQNTANYHVIVYTTHSHTHTLYIKWAEQQTREAETEL